MPMYSSHHFMVLPWKTSENGIRFSPLTLQLKEKALVRQLRPGVTAGVPGQARELIKPCPGGGAEDTGVESPRNKWSKYHPLRRRAEGEARTHGDRAGGRLSRGRSDISGGEAEGPRTGAAEPAGRRRDAIARKRACKAATSQESSASGCRDAGSGKWAPGSATGARRLHSNQGHPGGKSGRAGGGGNQAGSGFGSWSGYLVNPPLKMIQGTGVRSPGGSCASGYIKPDAACPRIRALWPEAGIRSGGGAMGHPLLSLVRQPGGRGPLLAAPSRSSARRKAPVRFGLRSGSAAPQATSGGPRKGQQSLLPQVCCRPGTSDIGKPFLCPRQGQETCGL